LKGIVQDPELDIPEPLKPNNYTKNDLSGTSSACPSEMGEGGNGPSQDGGTVRRRSTDFECEPREHY